MRKTIKGKRGWLAIETIFDKKVLKHYTHKKLRYPWSNENIFTAAYEEVKGELLIFSGLDEKLLIIKTEKRLLWEIGKVITREMRMSELLDILFEKGIMTSSMTYSTLEYHLVDKKNPDNTIIRSLWWASL